MSYNADTRTITLDGSIEKPPIDIALHMVHVFAEIYKDPHSSPSIRKDAEELFKWLGQDIDKLTPESTIKFKRAYLAYLSIGMSPSFDSQPLFDMIHALPEAKERMKLKPPTEIMDIFDRMIATDDEIAKKREHDLAAERKKFEQVFQKLNQKPKMVDQQFVDRIKDKVNDLSEKTKIFLSITFAWFVWVSLRTNTYFELLGHYFGRWDDDMFLQNFLTVPVLLLLGNFLYNRYIKKSQ